MKAKIVVIFGTILFTSIIVFAEFWKGKTLSASEVLKKWGNSPFSTSEFKTSNIKEKAKMTYSILKNKKLIGLDIDEIRKVFGQPDGFYFIDVYPAYIIQEGKSKSEETWQIVFLLNENYKVRDIIVHKNCCE